MTQQNDKGLAETKRIYNILTANPVILKSHEPLKFDSTDLNIMLDSVTEIIMNEPHLLRLEPPISISGGIHGQYNDLRKIFELGGMPPIVKYLFLGSYVNNISSPTEIATNSIEVILLLFALKRMYPQHIYLIRGPDSDPNLKAANFTIELSNRFSQEITLKIQQLFGYLPLAAIVGSKIFCSHGGFTRHLHTLEDFDELPRLLQKIHNQPLANGLIYSLPRANVLGVHSDNETQYYGLDAANRFLKRFGFDAICRSDYQLPHGYDFPFYPSHSVISLCSVPSTTNFNAKDENLQMLKRLNSNGALMKVDSCMVCSFVIFYFIDEIHSVSTNDV